MENGYEMSRDEENAVCLAGNSIVVPVLEAIFKQVGELQTMI